MTVVELVETPNDGGRARRDPETCLGPGSCQHLAGRRWLRSTGGYAGTAGGGGAPPPRPPGAAPPAPRPAATAGRARRDRLPVVELVETGCRWSSLSRPAAGGRACRDPAAG